MERDWYYIDPSCSPRGPVSAQELCDLASEHDLYVWKPGLAQWRESSLCPQLWSTAGRPNPHAPAPPSPSEDTLTLRTQPEPLSAFGDAASSYLLGNMEGTRRIRINPDRTPRPAAPALQTNRFVASLEEQHGRADPAPQAFAAHPDPDALARILATCVACLRDQTGKLIGIKAECSIGRSIRNDLIVPAQGVSRVHCQLHTDPHGHCWITDMDSENGTFLNGRRISQAERLRSGDQIDIPGARFHFFQS